MALRAYTPEKRVIEVKGQVLGEVQGLSLEHIATLVMAHAPDLEAVVDLFRKEGSLESLTTEDWLKLAMPVVTQAPGLAANIIACAAGEPEGAATIQSWPFSAQVAALMLVFELTFTEIGEVKKALGAIAALLGKTKAVTGTATKTSKRAK
jgi:hypothetical protein